MEVIPKFVKTRSPTTPKPWITPLYKLALQMYSKSHGLLPDYGVQFLFSPKTHFAIMPQSKINWKLFFLYSFSITQHILSLYALIHKYCYTQSHYQAYSTLDVLQTAILLMVLVWRVFLSDIVRLSFILEKEFGFCLNTLITANTKINKTKNIYKDYSGWLLVYLQLGLWIFGTPLPFILRFLKFDVWYTIFQEMGINQEVWFVWGFTLFVSAFSDITIGIRDIMAELLIIFAFLLSGEAYVAAIKEATQINPNSPRGLHSYICLMIIFKRMSIVESCVSGCFVIFSLIILSIFIWITVNCFRIVPLFMVAIFGAAFIGGLGIALFLISSFVA